MWRKRHRPRGLNIELLEARQMLASDVAVTSFASDGEDLLVGYSITGEDAGAFDVSIHRSADGVSPGGVLETHRVTGAGDLTVGARFHGFAGRLPTRRRR